MQSRLREVHLVLWDFLAIAFDLGLLVYASFWLSNVPWRKFPDWVSDLEDEHRDARNSRRKVRGSTLHKLSVKLFGRNPIWIIVSRLGLYLSKAVLAWLAVPLLAAALCTFNIGLFSDEVTGWRAAKFGLSIGGGIFAFGAFIHVIYAVVRNY